MWGIDEDSLADRRTMGSSSWPDEHHGRENMYKLGKGPLVPRFHATPVRYTPVAPN